MSILTVELHCHTYHSKDSLMLPEHILEICVHRDIDRIAITDHNAINGALEAATLDPERVIIGEEIMTTQGELLGYFMKEFIPPGLTPQETISRLRAQDAFISVAHPFDYTRQGAWQEKPLLEILDLVDALEIFNARTWSSNANKRAKAFANQKGLLGTAGSDAHAPFEIGRTVMNLETFNDAESMRQALSTATIQAHRSSPLVHLFSRYATLRKALGWKHMVR